MKKSLILITIGYLLLLAVDINQNFTIAEQQQLIEKQDSTIKLLEEEVKIEKTKRAQVEVLLFKIVNNYE